MSKTSAVVIGASGGIGAALVRQLESGGRFATVHALSRSGSGLDLEDEASIREAARVVSEGPPPALVIVATGVLHGEHQPERSYRALTAEHLLRDYRLNAIGPALVAKHFLPLMPREAHGVFAALSARVGSIGDNRLGGWHAYRASKAALNMLIRNLTIEHGRTHKAGIVVGLHPGTVATPLSAPFQGGVAPEKLFTPDHSAERLLHVIEDLTPRNSGTVLAWDGRTIPA
jgi:NAD(P)-dependent dehydrogenase (short-subunit alcohol dehydrogenase family)